MLYVIQRVTDFQGPFRLLDIAPGKRVFDNNFIGSTIKEKNLANLFPFEPILTWKAGKGS